MQPTGPASELPPTFEWMARLGRRSRGASAGGSTDGVAPGDRPSFELRFEELPRLHILRRVAPESVFGLLAPCSTRILQPGEQLFAAGDSNQTMYLVLSGRLSVHLDVAESEPVAFLEPGQTVGEMSVIDDSPASAYVIAATPARLLAVDEQTFWRLVHASHEFAANLLLLLAQRMRANNSTICEGARERRRFERDAMVDGLTGLYNRRWLDQRLPRLVERYARSGEPLTMAMVDVDHFKTFNDTYGHAAGDRVLAGVAEVIASCLRPTDLAGRYGGEEFVVILPGTDRAGARAAMERLRLAVNATTLAVGDGRTLPPVAISIGMAELAAGEGACEMAARADAALYAAKRGGRNRVEG